MSIEYETGYSLPSGDLPLNHARILHYGNSHQFTVTSGGTTDVASTTYTKNAPINALTFERYKANAASWTWEIDLGSAKEADCVCIAAHDIGTVGGTITLQQFTGSWTDVVAITPTDDSPIMLIFEPLTKQQWRLSGTGGAVEIGVFRIGNALQMERPFYQGFSPSSMARQTTVLGNISGSGELLGRSKIRTLLSTTYNWTNLTYSWVRTNLDGPNGLIVSIETEPFFLAWRPNVTNDVDFVLRATVEPPNLSGPVDKMTFALSAEIYAYE